MSRVYTITVRTREAFGRFSDTIMCMQGCCEHLLTFADVRMLHADDVLTRASYPKLTFESYKRRRNCDLCNMRIAVKVRH